jgi:hypothetical protein
MNKQRENWYIMGEKDPTGLYAIKRKAWEWRSDEYKQGFTVAISFNKIHEFNGRYEFIRNGTPIAILNKATARINGLDKVLPYDIVNKKQPDANSELC